jgi:hypothetical protein
VNVLQLLSSKWLKLLGVRLFARLFATVLQAVVNILLSCLSPPGQDSVDEVISDSTPQIASRNFSRGYWVASFHVWFN